MRGLISLVRGKLSSVTCSFSALWNYVVRRGMEPSLTDARLVVSPDTRQPGYYTPQKPISEWHVSLACIGKSYVRWANLALVQSEQWGTSWAIFLGDCVVRVRADRWNRNQTYPGISYLDDFVDTKVGKRAFQELFNEVAWSTPDWLYSHPHFSYK